MQAELQDLYVGMVGLNLMSGSRTILSLCLPAPDRGSLGCGCVRGQVFYY